MNVLRRFIIGAALCLLGAGFASLACVGETPEIQGSPDASSDAAGNDGAPVVNDAGADTGPGTFCSTKTGVAWCEDFDSPMLDLAPASNQSDLELGKLVTNNFVSAPRSFRFEMPAGRPPVQSTYLPKAFPNATKARLDLDLRIGTAAPSTAYQIMQLIILKKGDAEAQLSRICEAKDGGAVECSFYVSTCVAGINCVNRPLASLKALTDWTRITLAASFVADGHVSFAQGDVADVDAPVNLAPTVGTTEPLQVTLAIAVLTGDSTQTDAYFDNVVVETPP